MRVADARTSHRVLADFEEHTACAFGVHEEVQVTAGSGLNGRRNDCDSTGLQLRPGSIYVIDVQRNVMQPCATLAQKASYGSLRAQRLQ
jgi:hypothetical protein